MTDPMKIDIFVEDEAHERFLSALIARIFRERERMAAVRPRTARGGRGRVLTEFRMFQRLVRAQKLSLKIPDILVVGRDTNCSAFPGARQELIEAVDTRMFRAFAAACPDPHIERWYIADPDSFRSVVGAEVRPGRRKCERGLYKERLADAVMRGQNPPTLGGIEFARDLVDAMDLHRAGKNEPSLRHFIDDFQQAIAMAEETGA